MLRPEDGLPGAAADWIVPDWPAPPSVRALCTTRAGGISQGPYGSLNLGDHVGDLAEHVVGNRHRLAMTAGARPVFLRQVHGIELRTLDAQSPDGLEADACASETPGIACTVMVADCLPVLVCDTDGTRVGAAHCGWRGLAGGVLERLCESFGPPAPSTRSQGPIELMAWLGPCIGPQAFEVGEEVKQAFEAHAADAAACFRPGALPGKWLADLPALARQRLRALGVTQVHGNDGGTEWCTVANPSRFFSFRRDGIASGRFAALVWRV
ncbi:peptidoglycan editing factor PgeF [Xenophilus sp. Marseille-Q4582]|uniref:peptidoglycan editing factor PgeF n=1 Tax=Xenophilus sp. Marseille-Q4582 TaxID=2866600 RepID=UPI001CE48003|nr:peptidoglycan editing factor PgeF [Xenophilus sp. Marseille-Q4582]